MKEKQSTSGFWERGGFWKAVLVGALYVAVNTGLSFAIQALWGDHIDSDNLLTSATGVFFALALPIGITSAVFAAIAWRLGWLEQLFGRQPDLKRSWWMWTLPVIVLAFNFVRFAAVDYSKYTVGTILMVLVTGLLVGFGEELATRGFAVNLLRRAGYKELAVAALSSLVFASMHLGNIVGMEPAVVLLTVVYTFFFGIAMYLTMRVTRSLIWPMVLHATTDPSLILLSGGVDSSSETAAHGGLATVAGLANFAVVLVALVVLWFIRGQVDRYAAFGIGERPQADAARIF